ncbi:MAG: hypothetical protein ACYDG2_26690 [Ruminiclostridium sp.]
MKGYEKINISYEQLRYFRKIVRCKNKNLHLIMGCPNGKGLDNYYDCSNGITHYCGICWRSALIKDYNL